MAESDWEIVFYVADDGVPLVEGFLSGWDRSTTLRLEWAIEQLRQRNVHAREPLVRHIEGDLWELRRESNTNLFRLLYTFLPGRRILLLHGFVKKTPKTPRREIDIGRKRLDNFRRRAQEG